jgi:hypothetical protein
MSSGILIDSVFIVAFLLILWYCRHAIRNVAFWFLLLIVYFYVNRQPRK